MAEDSDFTIIGAGIAGLYAADLLTKRGRRVLHIERDHSPFMRASRINQQRVHLGHHYPRSLTTAAATARSFSRFTDEFHPAITNGFASIYGIACRNSYTSARQFRRFCQVASITAREIDPARHFNSEVVEAAFETEETTFDPEILCAMLLRRLEGRHGYERRCGLSVTTATQEGSTYRLSLTDGSSCTTGGVLNCTYAGINAVLQTFSLPPLDLKYELTEVAICRASGPLQATGVTILDGPFFSALPTGRDSLHTLTAVEFTPHRTSNAILPSFSCQQPHTKCVPAALAACSPCSARPPGAFTRMRQVAKKYLASQSDLSFVRSHFTVKTVLRSAEVDDSRPTAVYHHHRHPHFLTVLTGKIDAIYDIDRAIDEL